MLSEEEELRVSRFLNATDDELVKDTTYDPSFYLEGVRWLAAKCKELNYLSAWLSLELQEEVEKHARYVEFYEGSI